MWALHNPVASMLTAALFLSACAAPLAEPNYLNLCLGQTRVSGAYSIDGTNARPNGYPRVRVGSGGSNAEAVALEDCIQTRMTATGAAPAKLNTPPTVKGKLPYPSEYTLQPGDAQLWPTLTVQQQQRAILFLKSGSTIRSSLDGDQ